MTTTSTAPQSTWPRRLRGVALTYHRPAVWLLLTIALLAWGAAFGLRFGTRVTRPQAPDARPRLAFAYVSRYQTEPQAQAEAAPDWPQLRAIQLHGSYPTTLPQQLRQSTELEALQVTHGGWGGNSIQVERLTREQLQDSESWERLRIEWNQLQPQELDVLNAPNLSYLQVESTSLAPGTLRTFGQKFPIHSLVIDTFSLLGRSQELEAFEHLEYLKVTAAVLTPELIDAVLRIPRLKTLVISSDERLSRHHQLLMESRGAPFTESAALGDADLVRMRQHPTLQWVFADWQHHARTDVNVRESLRPLRAVSNMGLSRPWYQLNAALVGMMVLVLMLVMQLGVHFSNPTPLVLPRAASTHLIWATLVLSLGVAVAVVTVVQADLHVLPLAAVLLALPAGVSAIYVLTSRLTPAYQNLMGYAAMIFPLAMLFSQRIWEHFRAECRWFFLGEQPAWALLVIVVEILLIWQGLRLLPSLYRLKSERGTTTPLLLDPREQQQWWQYPERMSPSRAAGVWAWHQGRSDRRAALWRRSLIQSPWKQGLWMAIWMLVVLGFMDVWLRSQHSAPMTLLPWLPVVGMFIFSGFSVVFGVTTWSMRRLVMADELLRPARRDEFVRDIFRACGTSLWPLALGPLATVAFGVQRGWSAVEIACGVAWVTGVLLFTGAWGLWIFATRTTMLNRLLTSLPLFCSPVVIMLTLLSASHFGTGDMVMWLAALGLAGLFLTAAAALLTTAAYRRAVSREWGLD